MDPRLVRVPSADHDEGSMRDIFFAYELFPRYVGFARNVPEYFPQGNQTVFTPIGKIAQVGHTFAYFEETYGVLNEKQVAISESTCSGVFGTTPVGQGGKAIMSIDTLSQVHSSGCVFKCMRVRNWLLTSCLVRTHCALTAAGYGTRIVCA